MAASKTTSSLAEAAGENKGMIATAIILWGSSSLLSGAITAYSTTAFVVSNSALKAAPAILAPYLFTILAGAFNLLFGITLIGIGLKLRK